MRSFVLIVIYILAFAGSNLCFKKAGALPMTSSHAWGWFALGNVVGFLAPISITLALKQGSASWFFAIAIGAGFVVLQLSLWIFQQESMSPFQWAGMGLIVMGLILMNWGKGG